MGAKIQSQPKVFLNFLFNVPHTFALRNVETLKIEILNIFVFAFLTWDSMGVKIAKRYCSYKSHPEIFELLLKFSQWS